MPITMTLEFDTVEAAVAQVQSTPQRRPARLDPGRRLDRDGFRAFCAANPEVEAELLPDGTIALISPITYLSGSREGVAFGQLYLWWVGSRTGRISNSSVGYTLPDDSVRAPDAAWVSEERFAAVPEAELDAFPRLVPDFVIEVMSKTDHLRGARDKMRETWIGNGVRLGWLLRPDVRQALIYRADRAEPEVVGGFDGPLSAGEVVPGFSLDLTLLR